MALNQTKQHDECCVRCQSHRLIPGKFVSNEEVTAPAYFRWYWPKGALQTFLFYLGIFQPEAIHVTSESFLCLECGTAWTSINLDDARAKISKRGDDELKRKVGIDDKVVSLNDDFA